MKKELLVGVPGKTLDDLAEESAQQEIEATLKKYNCHIRFEQLVVNGVPIPPGRFRVFKNKEEPLQ